MEWDTAQRQQRHAQRQRKEDVRCQLQATVATDTVLRNLAESLEPRGEGHSEFLKSPASSPTGSSPVAHNGSRQLVHTSMSSGSACADASVDIAPPVKGGALSDWL
jgi:hypothetical protein